MRTARKLGDAGHEAVGQALLITAVGAGALTAAALGRLAIGHLESFLNTLTALV